jgi:hypothetical protein
MNGDTADALIGLWGVIIGAFVSLVASVLVPWVRDVIDRKRAARETNRAERRQWLLSTIEALLELRQAYGTMGRPAAGAALAKFGGALNQLTVRLTPAEQPVLDVIQVMLAMVQEPRPGIEGKVGEAMAVLVQWIRGDVDTQAVIPEVERRAALKFAADRKSASAVKQPDIDS